METVLFPAVLGLVFVEAILSGRWNKFYFEFGVPLFKKTINTKKIGLKSNVIAHNMNVQFKGTGYTSSLYFKEIDKNTIAFREKMFELSLFSYTPLMHGKIFLNPNNSNIQVTGLSNWFPIAFGILWYSALGPNISLERDFVFIVAPVIIFGVIYVIQRNKYIKLCEYLSDM